MTLFWANLLCLVWALPFLISLFFFLQTWDWLSGIGVALGLGILGPGITALSHICTQTIRDKHVCVAQDFLNSVSRDWKQSAVFAWIVGALWGVLAWAVRLVSFVGGGLGPVLAVVFILNAFAGQTRVGGPPAQHGGCNI